MHPQEILDENVYHDGVSGYTIPSGKIIPLGSNKAKFLYPFQWLWDTFFVAAWSGNVDQSISDIKNFLLGQRSDGFLGHIHYNRRVLSEGKYFPGPNIYYKDGVLPNNGEIISKITQPPNVSYCVWELAQKIKDAKKRKEFLNYIYPKIFNYHKYLYDKLTDGNLMVTIHPWQNGDDNSPKWDQIYQSIDTTTNIHLIVSDWLKGLNIPYVRFDLKLVDPKERPTNQYYDHFLYLIWLYGTWNWEEEVILKKSPFRVACPMTNAILLRSNQALMQIAEEVGETQDKKIIWKWIEKTKLGLDELWNEDFGLYFPKNLVTGEQIKIVTSASFIPIFSHEISKEKAQKLNDYLDKIKKDNPKIYLVPSTVPSETKYFDEYRYWRGPTWIIINELIWDGLEFYGFKELANQIRTDSIKLTRNNFYEYYNPFTGEGLGSPRQSWTAAAIIKMTEN